MENAISRRTFMSAGVAAAAAPMLGSVSPVRKRALRIAHLTDIHVQPERNADKGMARCLEFVNGLSDKPDVIFTGGDLIMDAFGADYARTKLQWDMFLKVLADHNSIPVEHCIGNHDIWNGPGKTEENEKLYGRQWACDVLGLSRTYRSFDRNGWHVVVIEGVEIQEGGGYKARLDEPQFEWLTEDLARTPKTTPTLVLSHIPILSSTCYFLGDNEKTGNWVVPGAWMHLDARRIKGLFAANPQVKVCIAGHMHLVDRVDYNGVTYFCDGAVSGGWWNGPNQEFAPGIALVDLYDDGSFDRTYVPWGWTPELLE